MAFAKPHRADFKHFRTRTASSRVIMPVDQDRAVAGILMLAGQFVLQAHDFLQHQPMQAPQSQLPADVFSLQDVILHGERPKRRRPRGA